MADSIKVFLCGDVMLGRGIDQILPHPSAPRIYEDYLKDAREYLRLAERESGPIEVPADFVPGETRWRFGKNRRRSCASSTWKPA
jgi:poly-gamma-glutamate capsule biosynthesis protein CapA/YwtB (metallophosphatase superfamily)